jgi:hypothetical protein
MGVRWRIKRLRESSFAGDRFDAAAEAAVDIIELFRRD